MKAINWPVLRHIGEHCFGEKGMVRSQKNVGPREDTASHCSRSDHDNGVPKPRSYHFGSPGRPDSVP